LHAPQSLFESISLEYRTIEDPLDTLLWKLQAHKKMLKAINSLNITVAGARQNSDTQKLEEDLPAPKNAYVSVTQFTLPRWCGNPTAKKKKEKEKRILLNFTSIKSQSSVIRVIWSRCSARQSGAKREEEWCSSQRGIHLTFFFF